MIGARLVRRGGVRDEEANLAEHFLHGAVGVVEERAFLMDGEVVGEFVAGRHGFLADPGDTILLDGNFQAVPVEGGGFGEMIFENDADVISLADLKSGTWAGAVVAPGVDGFERGDFAADGFGGEVEDFYIAIEVEREIRDVGRDHWRAGRWRGLGLVRRGHVMGMRSEVGGAAAFLGAEVGGCTCAEEAYAENGGVLEEFAAGVGDHLLPRVVIFFLGTDC